MRSWVFLMGLLVASAAHADWSYSEDVDKMTGKTARYAIARSSNSLSLSFPYAGANYGQLQVRQHPKYGLDVIVFVDKGQLLCGFDGCSVSVRFDDAAPMRFRGNGPADHDSKVLFLSPASKFIASAKKAKRVLVQLNIYQGGEQVLEFGTPTPLVWGSPAGKAAK